MEITERASLADNRAAPDYILNWMKQGVDILPITPKQKEIVVLMMRGFDAKTIAEILGNSEKTIKGHISDIYERAKVTSRGELFAEVFGL